MGVLCFQHPNLLAESNVGDDIKCKISIPFEDVDSLPLLIKLDKPVEESFQVPSDDRFHLDKILSRKSRQKGFPAGVGVLHVEQADAHFDVAKSEPIICVRLRCFGAVYQLDACIRGDADLVRGYSDDRTILFV